MLAVSFIHPMRIKKPFDDKDSLGSQKGLVAEFVELAKVVSNGVDVQEKLSTI